MSVAAVLDDYLDGLLSADTPAPQAQAGASPRPAGDAGEAVDARQVAAAVALPPAAPAPASVAPAAPVPRRPQPPATPPPAAIPSARASAMEPVDGAPPRRAADRSSRWLRLCCGDQRYGLELLKVQEVVLPVPLLPLRGTAASMLGVMNLRGQVVPVLDLGVYLGKPAQPDTAATRFVVLEEKGEVLGLRVSAVEDVVTLAEAQVEAPDSTQVRRSDDGLFRGIARQGGAPVVLLDASCLLAPQGHGQRR